MLRPLMKIRVILMTGRMLKIVGPQSTPVSSQWVYSPHLLEERSNQEKGIIKKATLKKNNLGL